MIKTSVIVPVYNEQDEVQDCLKSLKNQTLKDFEVIVVDDGSTDDSFNKAFQLKNKFSRLILLQKKHKGPGAARNYASKKARGKILVFLDADMVFEKDFLEKLIKPIVKKEAIGTFSKDEYLKNFKNPLAVCWNINRGLPKNKMHPENYPDKQKVFRAIQKDKFLKAGGFNEKAGYTDDWSLSQKLGQEALVAKGAVFYHKNPGNWKDIYLHSKWMSKRKYKFAFLGYFFALLRVSLPTSLVVGGYKSLINKMPLFLPFKVVSDWGQFIGIVEYIFLKKVFK